MSNVPEGLKYTKTHEWFSVKNGIATIGITDYAQTQMTDIVFVDFPAAGSKKEAGKQLLTIESVKSAEDVYSPVSGTVIEINNEISKAPEKVNKDPYGSWLVKIKVDKEGPSMSAQEYKKIIG